ncbi:MAG: bifunctional glutamate N-acetyltransferase/amino-acid acetyltransferase ArgJ [Coriobacteriales bacterium]|jgi:glutamate N-acetyltransferase/amino-acid N-acetyltransferase
MYPSENSANTKRIDFFDDAAPGVEFIGGGITRALGVSVGSTHAGFRRNTSKRDLTIVSVPEGTVAAGVFTKNIFCAAPVTLSREHLADAHARAIILNSGNANAATGEIGLADAAKTAEMVAESLGVAPDEVLVASTGVIGVTFDMTCFEKGIPFAVADLGPADGSDVEGGLDSAKAIMTTDTVCKQCAVSFSAPQADGSEVVYRIGGMAKGSGMIEPNMATMLSVIATDAPLDPDIAKTALKAAADVSFNRVSVDSDTSTNDSLYLLATGAAGGETIGAGHPAYLAFCDALKTLCISLARQIAADGEGATKLVTVHITGAADDGQAYLAARSVANSPLVKTAIAGHDANWGRLAMAIGKSGAEFAQEDVTISLMGLEVCRGGLPVDFDEEEALRRFEDDEIVITADLGCGDGASTMWTCDFTHGYITINGDYRT